MFIILMFLQPYSFMNWMAALALPVTILGGALYHLIFEAKAQYAYPYMVYMLPLAAIGLCRLEEGIKGLWKTKERRR